MAGADEGPMTPSGQGAGFGFSGHGYLLGVLVVTAALYALGWLFEDTRYWLNTRAFMIWSGLIPLWMCLGALMLRRSRAPLLTGIAISLLLALTHGAGMALIRGSLNDDMAGIAALVGGAALAGWILGRLVRYGLKADR